MVNFFFTIVSDSTDRIGKFMTSLSFFLISMRAQSQQLNSLSSISLVKQILRGLILDNGWLNKEKKILDKGPKNFKFMKIFFI